MNYCPPFTKPFYLLPLFLFLGLSTAIAQPYPAPGTRYVNTPIITCLDGYTGVQDPESYINTFPGFCGDLQNAHWIGFIAEKPDMVLSCDVFDCVGAANGSFGVQLSVLGVGNNCLPNNFYNVVCQNVGNWTQMDFPMTGLDVGSIYYIVIDGFAGDHCSYTLSLDTPLQGPQPPNPTLSGPTVVQEGSLTNYSTALNVPEYILHNPCDNEFTDCDGNTCIWGYTYSWTAPPGTIVIPGNPGDEAIITWGSVGGQVCVTIDNPCLDPIELCTDVTVVNVDDGPCNPGDPTRPGETCADAPFLCGTALHGFCGNTGVASADSPGNLSTALSCPIENNQWLRFTPCATEIHLAIETSSCLLGSSLEVAVLQTDDCTNFQSVLACQPLPAGFTSSFSVGNLIPGEVYYLMMDGINGQSCDYQIFVLDGISMSSPEYQETSPGFISGPAAVCPEEEPVYTLTPPTCMPIFADGCSFPEELAADLKLVWHLPPNMHFLGDSVDVLSIQVSISDTTDGAIYVTYETIDGADVYCTFGIGDCGDVPAFPVEVQFMITELAPAYICEDETFNFCGQDYNQTQTLVCPEYCGETRQELIVLPLDTIPVPVVELCEGDTYDFCGNTFSGTQSTILYCRNACEITAQEIIVHPKVVNDFGSTFFCPGDCYDFQGQQFCDEGTYEVEVPGAFGCDETFRITLVHYFPPALSLSSPSTDCEVNSNAYQVSFTILNGVPPFTINGQVITGNTYTSDWIANGLTYDFAIVDSDICPANTNVQGVFDCTSLCTTEAGNLQGLQLSGCGDEPVSVTTGNDLVLDVNDTYQYLLHDGTTTALGGILASNATGNFDFIPATMLHGQTYYISLLAGNENGGTVDTDDACASLSDGLPVVFYELPLASASAQGIITCTEEESSVTSGPAIPGAIYSWTGPGGFTSDQSEFLTSIPGLYELTVTSADGCSVSSKVTVEEKIEPPILDAGVAEELNCVTAEVQLDASLTMDGSLIDFVWQTTDGNFISGETTLTPWVNASGMYYFYAINRDNGCDALDSVFVTLDEDQPEAIVMEVGQPNCFGEASGSIAILEIMGGAAPYLYSLDGGALNQNPFFSQLVPGDYEVLIQDAIGCELTQTITLQEPVELVVDLGDDLYVGLGDPVDLEGRANFTPDSIRWTNSRGEVLLDTAYVAGLETYNFQAMANENITIELIAADECAVSDLINIYVDRRESVFIPNAFSPNGDGDNDYFTVFSGHSVDAVKLMTIYSRWGDVLYQRGNFAPNDPLDGWDGTYKGKRLNDGIFVYQVELVLVNGEEKQYTGDVLLMK